MKPAALIPALLVAATAAAAQDPERAATPPAETTRCATGPISYIFIDNHSIFDTGDPELDPRFAWAYSVANSLHVRTRADVIRRELLFELGDCYDPVLLEESERLLRAYDFLSHVDVFGVSQPDGSYHVVVDTQDEWSTQFDLRLRLDDGLRFDGIELREANLLGTGRALGLFYSEREVDRAYGAFYESPQLFGTRWNLRASVGRSRAGTFVTGGVAYPFVGEAGRWAARQSFAREDRLFHYVARGDPEDELHVLAPVRDESFDLAAVTRFGRPGSLTLLGAAVTFRELTRPAGSAGIESVQGGDFDTRIPADPALVDQVRSQQAELHDVRFTLLLGRRNIRWTQRRGLDSMRGEEDIRLGVETELGIGHSLPAFGGGDDDLFTSLAFYAGLEAEDALIAARLRGEGRRDPGGGAGGWRNVFAEGEVLAYWQPEESPRHTFLVRAAGAGGWHTRTPFQLTLGGDRGVRGYGPDRFPGGRRAVVTLEDRIYFGWPLRDVLDLGGSVFLDAGRIWPGDAPFGVDSGWRVSAGVGLRAALPAGGRTIYRIDLALPLAEGAGWDDLRLIISVGELFGLTRDFGDPQLLRSREGGISAELFHFPN